MFKHGLIGESIPVAITVAFLGLSNKDKHGLIGESIPVGNNSSSSWTVKQVQMLKVDALYNAVEYAKICGVVV